MKNLIRKTGLFLMMSAITLGAFAGKKAKANKDTENWRYEVLGVSVGAEGSYLLKVYSFSKKPAVAIEQAKKNAVHAVIFQGFTGAGAGCSQKALTNDPSLEQNKEVFFEEFFADGGKYMKYVNCSNSGAIAAEDIMKVGKEYKVGIIVSVAKDALRKDLEAAGIIKSLGSGF